MGFTFREKLQERTVFKSSAHIEKCEHLILVSEKDKGEKVEVEGGGRMEGLKVARVADQE